MAGTAQIAGVGMVPFTTPSCSQAYGVMGEHAAHPALATLLLRLHRTGRRDPDQ